jgi:hypothetical protein
LEIHTRYRSGGGVSSIRRASCRHFLFQSLSSSPLTWNVHVGMMCHRFQISAGGRDECGE